MPTNDERMAAAERLRSLCDYPTAATVVRACLGLKPGETMDIETRRRTGDRIADLIEPGKNSPIILRAEIDRAMLERTVLKTVVNLENLLALADEMERRKVWSCTAERDWSRGMARRIRKACGVSIDV